MSRTDDYTGIISIPKFVAAYTIYIKDGYCPNGTLDDIRKDFDRACDIFGREFKFRYSLSACLDYFPVTIYDLWEPGASLYIGRREVGRITDVVYDKDSVTLVTSDTDVRFRMKNVGKHIERILDRYRKDISYAREAEEEEDEEECIRRIAERFRV